MQVIGPLLLKNLHEAVNMGKKCEKACKDFESQRAPAVIEGWRVMKRTWEMDPSKPDPYKVVEQGKLIIRTAQLVLILVRIASNLSSAKLRLTEDEAVNAALPHKLSPSSFVRMGLELEDQQSVPRIPK